MHFWDTACPGPQKIRGLLHAYTLVPVTHSPRLSVFLQTHRYFLRITGTAAPKTVRWLCDFTPGLQGLLRITPRKTPVFLVNWPLTKVRLCCVQHLCSSRNRSRTLFSF